MHNKIDERERAPDTLQLLRVADGGTPVLLINARAARDMLGGISARLLFSKTKSGAIPSVRIGRRRMYDTRDLVAYVDGLKQKGARP